MQCLIRKPVVVNPQSVGARLGGKWPVDGGLPAALGIAFEMICEEACGLSEIVTQ